MCIIFLTNVYTTDHLDLEELGSYNLAGILCSMAVPLLSAWIVIITRQVVLLALNAVICFNRLFQLLTPLSHPFSVQAKHVHYSILVFW